MGVDLRRADVGVAEHLLEGAQVAPAGEEVRGERVAQRVRAHPVLQAGRAGMPADDLVQALTGQPVTAEVHEHPGLGPDSDELRAAFSR